MVNGDSFTEKTTQGWLSRIKSALVGIIVGPLLVLVAIGLLWWNEGRAIRTATALEEGKGQVITVSADSVNQSNNGKLVYLSGDATTEEILKDEQIGVEQKALMLRRHSEMYQWVEKKESSSSKNMGGSETTETKYTYVKEWADKHIDSNDFRKPQEHTNPEEFNYPSESWVSEEATIGNFQLGEELIQKLGANKKIAIDIPESEDSEESEAIGAVVGDYYYIGENSEEPAVGDIRISYFISPVGEVSVVAAQSDSALIPYVSRNGTSIALIQSGKHSSDSLFTTAQQENTIITWLIRLGGAFLTIIGLMMFMQILPVIGDVVPFIGSVIGFGTGLVSLVFGLAISSTTIALAWIAYRPVIACSIIVVAVMMIGFLYRQRKPQEKAAQAAAA